MHTSRLVAAALVLAPLAAVALAQGCAEAVETARPDAGLVALVEAGTDGGADKPGDGGGGGGGKVDAPQDNPGGVQINEVSPKGEEWLELVNASGSPKDLSGWIVADAEKDGGAPKIDEGLKIPDGTVLAPATYLVIVASSKDGGGACPAPAGSACLFAAFGISAKSGERLHLVRPDGSVATAVDLPPNAVALDGETWSRLPNGSGPFAVGIATPGAPNRAK